jgi:molecular chaperone HscB
VVAAPVSRLEGRPNYFELFGLRSRFELDRTALERKFYELSRALHPDRFVAAGPEALRVSLEKMSELNQAYRVLKDPALLRDYFLKLEGFDVQTGSQIPMELAESWFELQDVLMESPAIAAQRVTEFEMELARLSQKSNQDVLALEQRIDLASEATGSAPRELLESLAREIRTQNYLVSLERDVERIKRKLK